MEKKKRIRWWFWALALVCLVHFFFITVYSFRENFPRELTGLSDRYTIPLFHQNWKLFAPDLPRYNAELQYRIAGQGQSGWSGWKDASSDFGYDEHSRVETVEQGFVGQLGWQVMDNLYSKGGKKQFDRIVQSNAYASSLFMVLKLHQLQHPEFQLDSVQIRLEFRFTPAQEMAYNFQTSYLEFPVYIPQE